MAKNTTTADAVREEQLRIQAIGAGISRRDWNAVEQAYAAIRDEFDRRATPRPGTTAYGPYRVKWMGPGIWAGLPDELPAHLEGCDVYVVIHPFSNRCGAPRIDPERVAIEATAASFEEMGLPETAEAIRWYGDNGETGEVLDQGERERLADVLLGSRAMGKAIDEAMAIGADDGR